MQGKRTRSGSSKCRFFWAFSLMFSALLCGFAPRTYAQQSANVESRSDEDLLKAMQNPVSDLISLPIQSITNLGVGPYKRTDYALSFQPVIPVKLSDDWLLVSRVILPVMWQSDPNQPSGRKFGLGDMNPSFFLVPAKQGDLMWGVGPAMVLPTASDRMLGLGKFGVGPSAVILAQPGEWTVGVVASNVWSVAGSSSRESVNRMSLQYFVSRILANDWYISTAPTMVANWRASSGERWLVPVGAGIGKLVMFDKSPVDFSVSFYRNVVRPTGDPLWQLNLQVSLAFPK